MTRHLVFLPLVLGFFSWDSELFAQTQPGGSVEEYRVGQIWDYDAPPTAKGSNILILKISKINAKGKLVHVHINNMPLQCGKAQVSTSIGHLTVTERALRQSTTRLLVSNVGKLPDSYLDPTRDWGDSMPGIIDKPLSKIKLTPLHASLICGEVQSR